MSCTKITVKRGGSVSLQHYIRQDNKALDVTDWEFASTIKLGDVVVAEFDIQVINALKGHIELRVQSTDTWPLGTLQFDVRYTIPTASGPTIYYSPTVNLECKERITP